MKNELIKALEGILANTYILYLKTQNYHWHVKGPNFKAFHALFEEQYIDLADAVDTIAEQILMMGHRAPANFKAFESLREIKDGDSSLDANSMVKSLADDNDTLLKALHKALTLCEGVHEEGAENVLSDRVNAHEKARWMLRASCE